MTDAESRKRIAELEKCLRVLVSCAPDIRIRLCNHATCDVCSQIRQALEKGKALLK